MLMASPARPGCVLFALGVAASAAFAKPTDATRYDVLIAGGTVYDGSGGAPFVGDVAIQGDRIAYIGPHAPHPARGRAR
jgi:N-acyl-D-amino-acid deacylase